LTSAMGNDKSKRDTQIPKRYHLDTKQCTFSQHIGNGYSGQVYLESIQFPKKSVFSKREPPTVCAVKKFKRNTKNLPDERYLHRILRWPKLLDASESRFVKLYGLSLDTTSICCAMEFMEYGSLQDVADVPWLENDTQVVARQTLDALKFMHGHNILHLDLKLSAIYPFFTAEGEFRIKITDFGIKLIVYNDKLPVSERQKWWQVRQTTYMSEELFNFDGDTETFTSATDCWSVGCILYRLMLGQELSPPELVFRVMQDFSPASELRPRMSEVGTLFIEHLLHKNPGSRLISAEATLKESWVQNAGVQVSENIRNKLYENKRKRITPAPSETPQVNTGHWLSNCTISVLHTLSFNLFRQS